MKIRDYKSFGITRTQSWIVNALFKLLENDKFEVITVTEICQEADIARVTFYRNFKLKEDILRLYLNIIVADFFNKIRSITDFNIENVSRIYFNYWSDNREFLELIKDNKLIYLLVEVNSETEKYLKDLSVKIKRSPDNFLSKIDMKYYYSFYLSGLLQMVLQWSSNNYKESIDVMTTVFSNIYYFPSKINKH